MPIALTTGDPAGIGSDLIIQLAQQQNLSDIVVLTDATLLKERAQQLQLELETLEYRENARQEINKSQLIVEHIPTHNKVIAGELDVENSAHVLALLDRATAGCQHGEFSAMVTAPLHKGIINDAGLDFTGHTEYLAALTNAPLPVMMLATEGLRVCLATTHLPLKDVSDAITQESLTQVLTIIHHDLQKTFGIEKPHILVCGLNPHAGEGGYLGHEEIDTIQPVLDRLNTKGMHLTGALPADTLFTPRYLDHADAVLAMYHDQGLPVLKYKGFGKAINITLGLPIIRTSVDHGTALDLAGSGKADTGSLVEAIKLARELSASRSKSQ